MRTLPKPTILTAMSGAAPGAQSAIHVSPRVVAAAAVDLAEVYAQLDTRPEGLHPDEAARRLAKHGPNVLARDQAPGFARTLWRAALNPLVLLLGGLAAVSFATGDRRSGVVMGVMIALGVGLKVYQEAKAQRAASQLASLTTLKATALRGGTAREVDVAEIVPGDVVQLAAGDMIPGDVRVVHAKDLFVTQGALTGESFSVEKFDPPSRDAPTPLELSCVAFLGSSVESGAATAVVVATGGETYLGGMARSVAEAPAPTAFDRGIAAFTRRMLVFMAVLVPLVFVINGLTKGSWTSAFFFAIAVAVGLTPEMLPMIVSVCLARGAVSLSKKKVIVKRIQAIQNLGAMDVLCTDKTGTLTEDRVVLERYCDVTLRDDEAVLALAYLNSHFQTGLKSVLDRAVLAHAEAHAHAAVPTLTKVDEVPFDFQRRIMSVVVRTPEGSDRLIAKGAPEAIFPRCARYELDGVQQRLDPSHLEALRQEHERLSAEGFRVLALATRDGPARVSAPGATAYGKADEHDLVLRGYVAFLDPPKESAAAAIAALGRHGVAVKVVTGDNELVARRVCGVVGIPTAKVLRGDDLEAMSDAELAAVVDETTLFARVSPAHKQRVIEALQARGHTVGFMGDGINDAPALHAADVGVSVDTAVDVARSAADMILLERSLLVLDEGVMEGRRVFANILKYVRMGASSSFGNMFSVLGASVLLPYLPMTPVQILANNLLYDLGQTAVPTDAVDDEQLGRPQPWDIRALTRFIVLIGPCSSVFDYTTFYLMLRVFGCADVSTPAAAAHSQRLFQTGWFVESLLTQTLIVHIIRTRRIPFVQSRASGAVLATSAAIMAVGVTLPFTRLGGYLGFTALPAGYWPYLAATLLGYVALTQAVKTWLLRQRWL
jgi:Mg2+-importing ATPase